MFLERVRRSAAGELQSGMDRPTAKGLHLAKPQDSTRPNECVAAKNERKKKELEEEQEKEMLYTEMEEKKRRGKRGRAKRLGKRCVPEQ